MRQPSEIRARINSDLIDMLRRPARYGLNRSYELLVQNRLADLAFIDGAEERLEQRWAQLKKDGYGGAFGMYYAFVEALPSLDDYTEQLASVHARVAATMGYFEPRRRATEIEWEQLQRDVLQWAAAAPRARNDILARFGEPAYCADVDRYIGSPMVLGYAGPTDDEWLFFDLGYTEDGRGCCLRHLRLPAQSLRDSLVDLAGFSRQARPPNEVESPESVYRRFLIARLSADETALRALLLSDEHTSFPPRRAYPPELVAVLVEHYRTVDVFRVEAPPRPPHVYLFAASGEGPLALVRTDTGWKVDPRPFFEHTNEKLEKASKG